MDMKSYMNKNATKLKISGIRRFTLLAKEKEGCIGLTIGEPDFDTPDIIKQEVTQALKDNMTHYPDNAGYSFLRKKIADYEQKTNNLSYSSDEIIVTCGATEALHTALFSILNHGDEVILPTPDFMLYDSIVDMCGGVCVKVDTSKNNFQINEEMLSRAYSEKTKAIILNSPNNPTGCIYNEETLKIVHDFFKDKPVFIICDDVYNQLIFTENYLSFSSYSDMRDKIIVVQSFSKPYAMTGWRIGYIMAEQNVINVMKPVHQYTVTSIPAFVQTAAVKALDYDNSEMINSYKKRRDYVYKRLIDMGISVTKPEGAFYLYPSIEKFGMTSEEFCLNLIEKASLALTPGIFFGVEGYLRISYCYSEELLEEGMNRLEGYVKTL